MKTLNPANPENNGTLPAKKLYTQDEVDALLAKQTKIALLWTNPNPSSSFAAQTITVDGLQDYDFILIVTTYGFETFTIPTINGTSGSIIGLKVSQLGARTVTIGENTISFGAALFYSYSTTTNVTNNDHMKPTKILGIKL